LVRASGQGWQRLAWHTRLLSNIGIRRGVSHNDLVNNVLSQEVALAEALK
jgi:hypothetical protein